MEEIMEYFSNCTTVEELQTEFRRLAKVHHPDMGGDVAIMRDIIAARVCKESKIENNIASEEWKSTHQFTTYTEETDPYPTYYHHFALIDSSGCIITGWSDGPYPLSDSRLESGIIARTQEVICINAKGGYQFRLWPDGEENPSLMEDHGIPLYRWDGEKVVPRTAEEIAADVAALPPPEPVITPEQVLGQQVAQLTLENGELRQVVNTIGAEMVALKLQQTGGAQ